MRINDLGNTATDFASDDYIAIDGATNGSRKMKNDKLLEIATKEPVAKLQASVSKYTETLNGNNSNIVYGFRIFATPNSVYKISLSKVSWAVTSLGPTTRKLFTYRIEEDGSLTGISSWGRDDAVPSEITINTNSTGIGFCIGFRCDVGDSVDFGYSLVSFMETKDSVSSGKFLYISGANGRLYVEEQKANGGKVWLKAVSGSWRSAKNSTIEFTETNADFATRLGVSLETSAGGVSQCIPISNLNSLVLKADGDYTIKSTSALTQEETAILSVNVGKIININTEIFASVLMGFKYDIDDKITDENNGILISTNTCSFSFAGLNDEALDTKYYQVMKGAVYSLSFNDPNWAVTSLAAGRTKLAITFTRDTGIVYDVVLYRKEDTIPVDISFSVPSNVVSLKIRVRADIGENVVAKIVMKGCSSAAETAGKGQFYADGQLYIEENIGSGNSIYLANFGYSWFRRVASVGDSTTSIADFATALGVSLTTSPKGVVNCISIPNVNCLVINSSGVIEIKTRTSVTTGDTILVSCVNGRAVAINKTAFNMVDYEDAPFRHKLPIAYKSLGERFAEKCLGLFDSFVFFTDMHIPKVTGQWLFQLAKIHDKVRRCAETFPVNFVLSGGDWITAGDTQANTLKQLNCITGMFANTLKNYKPLLGNHDSNYLGTISDDDPSNGRFDQDTIDSLMFGCVGGKSYYTFDTGSTTYFCFDSGVDFNPTYAVNFRMLQTKWFAQKLLDGVAKDHIAIAVHIATTQTLTDGATDFTMTDFMTDLTDVATAYNARTSVTKDGVTFDFSGISGKYVEFVISGHSHHDASKIVNDIPIVLTTNFLNNRFDLVIVNYNTKKLNLLRTEDISGDREFDIYSASL